MSPVVIELAAAVRAWQDEQRHRLVRFIRLDAALTSLTAPVVVLVYVFIAREPYALVCGLVCAGCAVVMWRGAQHADRNDISAAIRWLAAGNWIAVCTGAILAPAVWPIFPIGSLLPAVAAAPYVHQEQFRRYLGVSIGVATAVTLTGLYTNVTSVREDLPPWVTNAIQATFVPLLTGTLGFLALQNFARLRSIAISLSEAHDAVRTQARSLFLSRSRMLAATDRERRRIERDLHDGTQQHFVAIGLKLAALKAQAPPQAYEMRAGIERIQRDVIDAQRNLRELVVAIYPPTLSQHGLASAVRLIADRYTTNVTTRIEDVGRCDPDTEAAVYFSCIEALQNASKHAGPTAAVRIELHRTNNELHFMVADDGVGFDLAIPRCTGGTINMQDRIGAVNGTLVIDSTPGIGTRVSATVPVQSTATEPERGQIAADFGLSEMIRSS